VYDRKIKRQFLILFGVFYRSRTLLRITAAWVKHVTADKFGTAIGQRNVKNMISMLLTM
jgi:hypothetical protein